MPGSALYKSTPSPRGAGTHSLNHTAMAIFPRVWFPQSRVWLSGHSLSMNSVIPECSRRNRHSQPVPTAPSKPCDPPELLLGQTERLTQGQSELPKTNSGSSGRAQPVLSTEVCSLRTSMLNKTWNYLHLPSKELPSAPVHSSNPQPV